MNPGRDSADKIFPTRGRIDSLQIGRGLAALLVLFHHLNNRIGQISGIDVTGGSYASGIRGADFFFVLSGFIISYVHESDIGRPSQWGSFVEKRFLKLYPVYWIYTVGVLAMLAIAGSQYIPHGLTWLSTATLIRFGSQMIPINVAWTLFHEVVFYFLFSILLLNKNIGKIALFLWLAMSIFSIIAWRPERFTPLSVWFNPHNLNFFLGMGALYASRRLPQKYASLLMLSGVVTLIANALTFTYFSPGYGLGFALLVTGAVLWEKTHRVSIPGGLLLGNASYSIFLIHEPVSTAAQRMLAALGLHDPVQLFVLLPIIATTAGVLAYLLVEKPLLARLKRHTINRTDQPPNPELLRSPASHNAPAG